MKEKVAYTYRVVLIFLQWFLIKKQHDQSSAFWICVESPEWGQCMAIHPISQAAPVVCMLQDKFQS